MTVDDNKGYIDKTQNHYDVIYVQPLTTWQSFMIYITQWDQVKVMLNIVKLKHNKVVMQ